MARALTSVTRMSPCKDHVHIIHIKTRILISLSLSLSLSPSLAEDAHEGIYMVLVTDWQNIFIIIRRNGLENGTSGLGALENCRGERARRS